MDIDSPQPAAEAAAPRPPCCARRSLGWRLLRAFGCLLVLGTVFLLGACAGLHARGPRDMFVQRFRAGSEDRRPVDSARRFRGPSEAGAFGAPTVDEDVRDDRSAATSTRLFGVVTRIEGNRIFLVDNAAAERIVVSQAETAILTPLGEVGLGALRVGQAIVAIGPLDPGRQLLARLIQAP